LPGPPLLIALARRASRFSDGYLDPPLFPSDAEMGPREVLAPRQDTGAIPGVAIELPFMFENATNRELFSRAGEERCPATKAAQQTATSSRQ
jgi:hypothetical protein